ncbi:glutamate--tRNA ligase [Cohnella thailandensis]|uniref:Glutamate--tRNA ligase n=1 Tax=Cohnella thailandensis TaxID=557557 RepID=A0A841T0B3_9BACL|nr:glutamate--tRNA ligase [Cohnella thailandensis]MBB6636529.1 glutamate--tRNA ligase [Cohnella thailandensis]MBP1977598.1 nondiscriminating glutamyl-tRNA synthetase [Cohnella thailandensis]
MSDKVRVRYAPSPTGHLHIGNARTAIFNYLFARHHGGEFIIRIEDTDVKRNVAGGEESQLKYLKWLGVDWDESVDKVGQYGPYRQTERLDIYREYWRQLIDNGQAYRCYCTEEELEKEREEQSARGETPRYSGKCRRLSDADRARLEAEGRVASVRFRVPEGKTYAFDDMVKGEISFKSEEFGDFVIVKKDGIPTYNYAVALDDHLMAITHVLRGEDHITNTPRQLMVYEAHGWEPPIFGHMTLIVNESRKKLSKRDESIIQFIEQYDNLGYSSEALFNFITLLGWSPEGEEEIFTRERLIEIFDANRLSKSPAVFDTVKLNWINQHYLKGLPVEELAKLCFPHLKQAERLAAEPSEKELAWATALVTLYRDHLRYGAEIVPLSDLFFREEVVLEDDGREVLAEESVPAVLSAFARQLEAAGEANFTEENIKAAIKAVQKETGAKGKGLFMPIRVALTGQTHGPDLNGSIWLLGYGRVLKRLEDAAAGKLA